MRAAFAALGLPEGAVKVKREPRGEKSGSFLGVGGEDKAAETSRRHVGVTAEDERKRSSRTKRREDI